MIKFSKAASKLYSEIVASIGDELVGDQFREFDQHCDITLWETTDHAHSLLQEYDGKDNITFFWDNPDEVEFLCTSSLTEDELLKKMKQFHAIYQITLKKMEEKHGKKANSGIKVEFKPGDICWHPKFGTCKVIKTDSHGLVEVRWPENSSSQSHHSLVDPDTLTKRD